MRLTTTTSLACVLLAGVTLLALTACGGGAATSGTTLPSGAIGSGGGGGGGTSGGAPTGGGGSPLPVGDDGTLVGGWLLVLEQEGESYAIRITNPTAVDAFADIQAGRMQLETISGPILPNGPTAPGYYDPWSWHVDPAQVSINALPAAPLRYEGRPSLVEADLAALVAAGTHKVATWRNTRILVIHDWRGTIGGPTQPPEPPQPR